jgi:hypothetical protein
LGLGAALVLAASFLAATPLAAGALGNNYYVTTAGTATAACTVAAPCTIAHALTLAGDGDTINVAAGTYANTASLSIAKGVTISGAGAATTIINGSGSAAVVKVALAATDTTPVTISGVTIQHGKVAAGGGGGIDDTGGALNVNNATITGDDAGLTGGGGILSSSTGQLTLTGDTISTNTSTGLLGGGGVLLEGPATITDTTISGNNTTGSAAGVGGGILIYKAAAAENETESITDSTITGNTATYGAAIGVASASGVSGASLSFTGDADGVSTMSDNTAATGGGGLFITGANTANVTDSSITGNTVTNLSAGTGGGIDIASGSVVTLTGDGVSPNAVSSNEAIIGAGIAVASGGTANMSDSTIDGNLGGVGGGLYVAGGGAATMNGGSIATNGSLDGGGAAIAGTLSLVGVSVTNNVANADGTANLGNGGGVLDSGALSITAGSTLSGNQAVPAPASTNSVATGLGGAVFAGPTAAGEAPTFTLSNSTVSGGTLPAADPYNAAEGGGIAITGNVLGPVAATPFTATPAVFTGTDDTFSGLVALAGGAAYIGGSGTYTGSTITGNTAALEGGGLFVGQGTSTDVPSATVDSTTISSNTAPVGGGIFLNLASSLTVQNGSAIAGNTTTAGGDGGGILSEGALTITNSSLTSNTAVPSSSDPTTTGLGGAISSGAVAANATTTAVLSGDTFSGNTAGTASALATLSTGTGDVNTTSITNSTFNGNTTTPSFGTIDADEPVSIVSSTIDGNTSPTGASGGIVTAAGDVSVAGSDVTNNSGGNCTGAVVDGGYNFTSASDTSCGFATADNDGSGDPQLGALTNNGGPTQTELPAPSSPLINQIPPNTATGLTDAVSGDAIVLCGPGSVDQRGNARPSGTNCDIGSVEVTVVAPTVSGPAAATFVVGQAGTAQAFTSTGTPTPTISESGALPSGVKFTATGDDGTLSGTPAAGTAGSYPITVTAANGVSPDGTLSFTLTVDQVPSAISGPSSDTYIVNATGSDTFTATGAPAPTISESGALPGGVTFDSSVPGTGTLSGTPASGTQGTYSLTITASNGVGTATTKTFTLTVVPAVSITTTSLPDATATVSYSTTLAASGGKAPYTWSLSSGTLPAGLTLSSGGTISGTPSGPAGTATFVVKVTDSASPHGTATQSLSIATVVKAPTKLVVSSLLLNPPLDLTLNTARATLTGGNPLAPLSGQTVVFTAGSTTLCSGMTNTSGVVTCSYSILDLVPAVLNLGVTATYAGNGSYLPSTGSAGLL